MAHQTAPREALDVGAIDHRPLREQIADRLQEGILAGELVPGQAIIETEVAGQFHVSRAPVREALQILANRGLVTVEPYRGTTVRRLERKDVEEAYGMRSVLEAFAIRRVMKRIPAETAAELRRLCGSMEFHAKLGDWRSVSELDDRFHATLIRHAEHAILTRFWNDINMRVRQIMSLRNLKNEDILQIVQNHLPIIEAIEAGDESRAIELTTRHIETAGDLMLEQSLFEQ